MSSAQTPTQQGVGPLTGIGLTAANELWGRSSVRRWICCGRTVFTCCGTRHSCISSTGALRNSANVTWRTLLSLASLANADGRDDFTISGAGNLSDVTPTHVYVVFGSGELSFIRGDCNGDGHIEGDVSDAVFLLSWLFLSGSGQIGAVVGSCRVDDHGAEQRDAQTPRVETAHATIP